MKKEVEALIKEICERTKEIRNGKYKKINPKNERGKIYHVR